MYVCMCFSVADEQHWQFQTYKHSLTAEQKKKDPSEDVKQGFYTKGKNEIFKMGTLVLYVHKELHTYIHTYTYIPIPLWILTHSSTYTSHIHTYMHTYYLHTKYKHIHTYIRTHTQIGLFKYCRHPNYFAEQVQ